MQSAIGCVFFSLTNAFKMDYEVIGYVCRYIRGADESKYVIACDCWRRFFSVDKAGSQGLDKLKGCRLRILSMYVDERRR